MVSRLGYGSSAYLKAVALEADFRKMPHCIALAEKAIKQRLFDTALILPFHGVSISGKQFASRGRVAIIRPMPADLLRSLPKAKAAFIQPMDCLPVSKLPEGPQWLWEILCGAPHNLFWRSALCGAEDEEPLGRCTEPRPMLT
jgi:hypothetical protein